MHERTSQARNCHHRRFAALGVIIAAWIVVVVAGAPDAHAAGTYRVYSCNQTQGTGGNTALYRDNIWSYFGTADHQNVGSCNQGFNVLQASLIDSNSGYDTALTTSPFWTNGAGYSFAAPSSTTFSAWYFDGAFNRRAGATNDNYYVSARSLTGVTASDFINNSGSNSIYTWDTATTWYPTASTNTNLEIAEGCFDGDGSCAQDYPGTGSSFTAVRLDGSWVDIYDSTAPAISSQGGTLWTNQGSWQRGSLSISFAASDQTGISSTQVYVHNGASWILNSNTGYACDYHVALPCSNQSHSSSVNTASYPDGARSIILRGIGAATDNLGDSSFTAYFDNTVPTGGGISYAAGPTNAGSTSITLTAGTDATSGVSSRQLYQASAAYSAGGCSGWSGYTLISTNPASPYTSTGNSHTYCYRYMYRLTDAAGNTQDYVGGDVQVDAAVPTGGGISYTAGVTNATSRTMTLTAGSDALSGMASRTLWRATATYSAGSCGLWSAYSLLATNPATPYTDTGLVSGTCYRWMYRLTDNAGNNQDYDGFVYFGALMVDTAAPTNPTQGNIFDLSTTFSGDKAWSNNTTALSASWNVGSDGLSGVASYDVCFSTVNSGCTNIAGTTTQTGNTTRTATATASPAMTSGTTYYTCVRTVDNAGNTSAWQCSNGFTIDTVAPSNPVSSAIRDLNSTTDRDWTNNTYAASMIGAFWTAGTDALSGFQSTDACFTSTNISGLSSACTPILGTLVDVTAVDQLFQGPPSPALVHGGVYYTCIRTVDNAGNKAVWVCSDGWTVDTAAPTNPTQANIFDLSTTFSGDATWTNNTTALSGSWNVGSDSLSGVASYDVCFSTVNSGCTNIAGTSTQTGNTTRTASATASPAMTSGTTYYTCVRTVDNAGNTSAWQCSNGFTVDTVAPSGGYVTHTTGWITSTVIGVWISDGTDSLSGLGGPRFVERQSATISGGSCGAFGAWSQVGSMYPSVLVSDNSIVSGNCYQYRYRVPDVAGNSVTYGPSGVVMVDTAAPSGGSIAYADGWTNSTSVSVTLVNGSDAVSGLGIRVLERQVATLTGSVCGSYGAWAQVGTNNPVSPVADTVVSGNCYIYRYRVPDLAGNSTTYTSGSVVKVDTAPPAGGSISYANGWTVGTGAVSAGVLDPTFDSDGKVASPAVPGAEYDFSAGSAVQSDGKILTAGGCTTNAGSDYNFCIQRFTTAGALDPSFGSGGTVMTNASASVSGFDTGQAMVLQSDGKSVVVGYCDGGSTSFDFCVVRYASDGSLDGTFGVGGIARAAISSSWGEDTAVSVVLQPSGKVVVAGYCNGPNTAGYDVCLARLTSNGLLDPSFGTGGKVITSPSGANDDLANDIAVDSLGRLIVTGFCEFALYDGDFCTVRYTVDGALDTSFDVDGWVATPMTPAGGWDASVSVAVQTDSKIVVAGNCTPGGGTATDFCLVRYNDDGTLDTSFDADGKLTTAIAPGGGADSPYSVAVGSDGIVVAGNCQMGATGRDMCAARYANNGALDTTFDSDGKVSVAIAPSAGADYANSISFQSDGKTVLAGSCEMGGSTGTDVCLARLTGAGAVTSPPITLLAGSDSLSGLGVYPTLERATASLTGPSCGAFGGWSSDTVAPASPFNAVVESGNCYKFRYVVPDNAGNSSIYVTSNEMWVDSTLPVNPSQGNIFDLSTTFTADKTWSNNSTALSASWNAGSDSYSGVATYDVCFSTSSSGCGPVGSPANLIAGTSVQAGNTTRTATVTATGMTHGLTYYTCVRTRDVAGNVSAWQCSNGFTIDTAGPTGGSISYTNGWINTTTASITMADGSDSVSGIGTPRILERQSATLTGSTCGAYGAWGQVGSNNPVSPASDSVVSGNCYVYRYRVPDVAGNAATYISASVLKVDTVAPSGGSVTYTNGWSNSTTASVAFTDGSDALSGVGTPKILERQVATLSGSTCGAYGAWAQVGANNPVSPVADTVASGNCYKWRYTVPDAAGNSAIYTSTNELKVDTAAPSGGSVTYTNGWSNLTSASIVFADGTDALSGIGTPRVLERQSATLTGSTCGSYGAWTQVGANNPVSPVADTVASGNCYKWRYTVPDAAGNSTTYTSANELRVDTAAPTGGSVSYTDGWIAATTASITFTDGTDPLSGIASPKVLERQSAPLTGATCGSYGAWSQVGTNDPVSPYADTTVASGNCYQYRYRVPDVAGTTATYTSASVLKVDTVAPSGGNITYADGFLYNTTASISFADGSDALSGIGAPRKIERQSATRTGSTCGSYGGWSQVGSNNPTSPTTDNVTTGTCYKYRYTVPDVAGNTVTYTSANEVKVDVSGPTGGNVTYTDGWITSTTATVTFADGTATMGIGTPRVLERQVAPLTGATCGAYAAWTQVGSNNPVSPVADTVASGNCYQYRYIVRDTIANVTTYTSSSVLKVDTVAPAGGSITYTNGWSNSTTSSVAFADGTDALSGIGTPRILERQVAPLSGSTCGAYGAWAQVGANNPVSSAADTVANGNCYKYRYIVPDAAGNSTTYTSVNELKVSTIGPSGGSVVYTNGWVNAAASGFDVDGIATTPVGPGSNLDYGTSVAAQADGKIVVAGYCDSGLSTGRDICVVRYTSDGALDTTFDSDGKVITAVSPGNGAQDQATGVVVQADGKIVVAGLCDMGATGFDMCVARYTSSGALDTTFDTDGKVSTAIGPSNNMDAGRGVALQADGKIVVAGACYMGATTGWDVCAVRYTTAGALDTTFDSDGVVTTAVTSGAGWDEGYGVGLQADGKIVVAGLSNGGATGNDVNVVRYTSSGALDTTFDSDGLVTTSIAPGSNGDSATSVAVQADGKIVVAGYCDMSGTGWDICAARYTSAGALDTTFDSDGKVSTPVGSGSSADRGYGVGVQLDGKIVVVGHSNMGATTGLDVSAVRYTSGGALDTTFDSDGKVTTAVGPGANGDEGYSVALQADGKIVVAGQCDMGGTTGVDMCVVRYGSDGSPDRDPRVIQLSDGTAQSGIATPKVLERQVAPLSGSTCGVYGAWAQVGSSNPPAAYLDASVASGNCYMYRYVVPDNAGNSTTYTSVSVLKVDTVAPSGGSVSYTNGWSNSTSASVSFVDGSDALSGLGSPKVLERQSATLTGSTCGAYGVWTQVGANNPVSPASDTVASGNCYKYRYTVPDAAGNSITYTSANELKVDTVAPAGGSITYTDGWSNSTTASVAFADGTDALSGITTLRVLERQVAPLTGSTCGSYSAWAQVGTNNPVSPAADTVASGNCYQYRYRVPDAAGNSATYTSVSVLKVDTVAPAGGSVTYTNGWITSTSASVTFTDGTDALSGIGTPRVLERQVATLTGSTCGLYGAWAQVGTNNPVSPAADTVASGNCYKYRYTVPDVAGNSITYTSANELKVDTVAPAGGSVTYTNGWSNSTTASVAFADGSDALSGIGSPRILERQVAPLTGATCGSFGAWAQVGANNPVSSVLDTVASGNCYQYRYTVPDVAGNSAVYTSANVLKIDTAAPTGGSVTYTNGWSNSTTASVTFTDGTDALSGLGTPKVLERQVAPLTGASCGAYGAWTQVGSNNPVSPASDTVASGNCYKYRYIVPDAAGNSTTYTSANELKVDTAAPSGGSVTYTNGWSNSTTASVTFTDGTDALSGLGTPKVLERQVAPLTGATCGAYGVWTQVGVNNPVSPVADTVASGNCYKYRYRVPDTAGNSDPYTSANELKIDTAAPTGGSVTYTNGFISTSTTAVSFSEGSDALSGIGSPRVLERQSATLTGSTCGSYGAWGQVGANNPTSPFTDNVTTGNCYKYRYTVPDAAGNSVTYTSASELKVSNTGPSGGSVSYTNGWITTTTTSVTFTDGTAPSGIGTPKVLERQVAPLTGATCGSYGAWTQVGANNPASPYTDTVVSGNCYMYRYTVPDNSGNSTIYTNANELKVDTAAPAGGSVSYTNGWSNAASITFTEGTDALSGISVPRTLERQSAALTGSICGSYGVWAQVGITSPVSPYVDTTAVSGNCYRYQYKVADAAGNTATFTSASELKFDTVAPTGGSVTYTNGWINTTSTSVTFTNGTDALSGIGSPRVLERQSATLTGATCGAYGAWSQVGSNNPVSPATDSTLATGNCYKYRYTVPDTAGNSVAYVSANELKVDIVAPTGGSITYTDGWIKTTTTSITLVDGTDTNSGLGTRTLQRQSATFSAGACGVFGAWTTTNTNPVSPVSNTVVSGNCYKYQYIVADAVGNTNTYTSSSVLKVDTVAPSANSLTGSGWKTSSSASITILGTSTDTLSGIASPRVLERQEAPLSGGVCGAYGGWTQVGANDPTSPVTDTGLVSGTCYLYRYLVPDVAGNLRTNTLASPVKVDMEFPSGGGITYADGWTSGAGTATSYVPDLAFGTAGAAAPTAISPAAGIDTPSAVVTQPDGKIVVAGTCAYIFCLARYTAGGVLDTEFDSDGIQTTSFAGATSVNGSFVLLQPDGKILVIGNCQDSSSQYFCLARYTIGGALDTSFDGDGMQTVVVGDIQSYPLRVFLQADGKILIAGACSTATVSHNLCAARITTTGALDTTFDGDGITPMVQMGSPGAGGGLDDAFLQPDGKLVIVGDCLYAATGFDFCLARYATDGSLDTSFDTDGIVSVAIAASSGHDLAADAVLQSDGKIVIAGECGGTTDACLARLTSAGALDTTFDTDGKVVSDLGGNDGITSVEVLTDGKLLVAAKCGGSSTYDTCVARFTSGGTLDSAYGTAGFTTVTAGSQGGYFSKVMPDGSAWVKVGCESLLWLWDSCLMRFTPSGALDTTLDFDGVQPVGLGSLQLNIMSDNSIVAVAGCSTPSGGTDFCVFRYAFGTGVVSPPISLVDGSDTVSGLGDRMVEVQSAPLTGGVCGAYGAWSTSGAYPASTHRAALSSGWCHQFRYRVADNAVVTGAYGGNTTTYTTSSVMKVDAEVPANPAQGDIFDLNSAAPDKDWSTSTTALSASWAAGSDAVSGIRDYDVCFSTVNTGCTNIAGTTTATGNTSRAATATATAMTSGTTYFTCVRSWDLAGNTPGWQCSDGFTVDGITPTAPSQANIFDLSTTFSGDLDWSVSATNISASWNVGADSLSGVRDYDVCFSTANNDCSPIGGTLMQSANTTRTATAVANGLVPGATYYSCVRVWDIAGNSSAWSCSDGFGVDTTAPSNPAQAAMYDLSVTFADDRDWSNSTTALSASWGVGADSGSGVRDYDVCFSTNNTGCSAVPGTSLVTGNTSRSVIATSSGMTAGSTYYVCVRTWDVAGNNAGWGCSDGFTIDVTAPTVPASSDIYDVNTAAPDRDWSNSATALTAGWAAGSDSASGVRDYDICFSTVSNGCAPIPGTAMQSANTTRQAAAIATGMTSGVPYYSCVRVWDVAGNTSGWMCSDGFVVDSVAPSNPSQSNVFDLSMVFGPDQDFSTSLTTLSVSWGIGADGASGVRDYDVCFSSVNTGCTAIAGTAMQSANTSRTATATATGLTNGSTYYACVRTWDNAGNNAGWTCSDGFVVDVTAPAALGPNDVFDLSTSFSGDLDWGASTTALSMSWLAGADPISGVRDYEACFSSVSSGCTPITGTSIITGNTTRIASATATGMTNGAAYYSCVRVFDNAGNVSAWQCSDGFVVDTILPAAPTQGQIFDLSITGSGDLDWSTSSSALSASWSAGSDAGSGIRDYDVCFSTVNTGCTPIAGTSLQSANTSRTATATAAGMSDGVGYFVCVRAYDNAGNVSAWVCSDGFSVDTVAPANPTIGELFDLNTAAPDKDWTNSTTALSAAWLAGTDVTSGIRDYSVCFSTQNNGCSNIAGTSTQTANTTRSASATATGLVPATTYYTCVRAFDNAGNAAGSWVCSDGFALDAGQPQNPTQANIYDLSVTFAGDRDWTNSATALSASWGVGSDGVSGLRDYDVCFSTSSSTCANIPGTSTQTGNTSRTATATATGLVLGTTYYVCVQTNDNAGNSAGWTCSDGFALDQADPVNPTQANLADLSVAMVDADWTNSPTVLSASWNAGSDALSGIRDYDVCFSTVNTGCTNIAGTTTQAGNTTRTATATATGLVSGTTYFTCVRSWDNAGNNAGWVCSDGFTYDAVNPANPAQADIIDLNSAPPDRDWSASVTALSASWSVGTDALSGIRDYDVCFSTVSTGCTNIAGTTTETGNTTRTASATATGMANGVTYYTCVRAWDRAGNSAGWSCSDGFTIDTSTPTNPVQASIFDLDTTFTLDRDWNTSVINVSSSWNAGADTGSGVRDYDVCYSTSSTNCVNIPGTTTQSGNTTRTSTQTATALVNGTTYYTCVRAYDVAGNVANWTCSDGFNVDSIVPNNPAQVGIYDLSATWNSDVDFTNQTTSLVASWNTGSDVTSGVRDYDVCFSTASNTCTNIAGTSTQTGNTSRTATATATGMISGTTYYTCVRATDNAGNTSSWQCSDGFTVDTASPINPTQANIFDLSVTYGPDLDSLIVVQTLSGSFNQGSDTISGVRDYDVCFSSSNTNCINISGTTTQTGNTTRTATATATGMIPGTMYYTCVRTTDNANNTSGWQCSDGFLFDAASSSISIDANSKSFGQIIPGTDKFTSSTLTVATNNTFGYTLTVSDTSDSTGMTCTCTGTIPDWTGTSGTPTLWAANTAGYFGLTIRDASLGRLTKWGTGSVPVETDTLTARYAGIKNTTNTLIHNTAGPTVGNDTILATYRVNAGLNALPGRYTTSITYTITPNP